MSKHVFFSPSDAADLRRSGVYDRRIGVDDLLPGWCFFDERPDPVDDVAGSTGLIHNAGERRSHLRHVGWALPILLQKSKIE
jgi:hypothetical protein